MLLSWEQKLTHFIAVPVSVDIANVRLNVLLPGLLVFRITDHKDEKGRLHNGYQLLYTGPVGGSVGVLKATLVSTTQVVLVMPAVPWTFWHELDTVKAKMTAERI